jgi:hypothetical protein
LCCSDGELPALRSNCTSIAATTEQKQSFYCAFSCLYSLAPHKIRVSADGLFGGSPPKKFHPQNTPRPPKENKGNRKIKKFNPKFQPNSTQISAKFNPKKFHPQISTQFFKPNFFFNTIIQQ